MKKQKKVFIISEFNPFHRGHEYLISKARELFEDCTVVCIMGGNFTQRGECACADKYIRAEAAVRCGADAVLLLPSVYASGCAEAFALGAVRLACDFANEGDILFFGSECGDIEKLSFCADKLSSEEFISSLSEEIKKSTRSNMPYAVCRQQLFDKMFGCGQILSTPNNILGIEYIKAINLLGKKLTPKTAKRTDHPSASEIRKLEKTAFLDSLPGGSKLAFAKESRDASFVYAQNYVLSVLRGYSPDEADKMSECSGGLGRRIISCAKKASSYEALLSICATKKYTGARISRAITALLLKITDEERLMAPTYTVLLAANKKGLKVLKDGSVEIAVKPADSKEVLVREADFDNLYALCSSSIREHNFFLKCSPFILK